MDNIETNINEVVKRINNVATKAARTPESIKVIAVSKTVSHEIVRLAASHGMMTFGENYIQEAKDKIELLSDLNISWHFIGHLQTNKAKYAVRLFDMIQTVDSVKLGAAIDKEANKIGKIQDILIQINIQNQPTKSGVSEQAILDTVKDMAGFKNIRIKGLMTMPPYFENPEESRPFFHSLAQIKQQISELGLANVSTDELSMGMSNDFEVAIQEGATIVRIGTAIFGKRTYCNLE